MPPDVTKVADDDGVLQAGRRGLAPDEDVALHATGDQLPVELAATPRVLCAGWVCHQLRMFTALATTRPIVTSAVSDWAAISDLAIGVNGIVSVGLNAVALVNDVYR